MERGVAGFVVEEPAFAGEASGVAGELAASSDDAVAGDDDGDGVGAICQADGAAGGGAAEVGG